MSLVVVGSIALDSVKTPFGKRVNALGGSATFSSYSASFFTPVKLVGVVGKDFPKQHVALLYERKVDLAGLQIADGKTFRWSGSYEYDMNSAKTLETHLNVFQHFQPRLPESYQKAESLFLANIDPDLQIKVLRQVRRPRLVAADTMNLWISIKKPSLRRLCRMIDVLVLNDGEARQFTGVTNLIKAGKMIRSWGPKYVVIKKGEHGAVLFGNKNIFVAPAYPLENVFDPTGAGDTFAGGFMGYLDKMGARLSDAALYQALLYGTVMASFTVEDFSLDRLKTVRPSDIQQRIKLLRAMTAVASSR